MNEGHGKEIEREKKTESIQYMLDFFLSLSMYSFNAVVHDIGFHKIRAVVD